MLLDIAIRWSADKKGAYNFNPLAVIAKCLYFNVPHGTKHTFRSCVLCHSVWTLFTTSIPVQIFMEKGKRNHIKNKIRTRNEEFRNTTKTAQM